MGLPAAGKKRGVLHKKLCIPFIIGYLVVNSAVNFDPESYIGWVFLLVCICYGTVVRLLLPPSVRQEKGRLFGGRE